MHLKSSAGRPKGKCKGTVSPSSKGDSAMKGNMAVQASARHVDYQIDCGHPFSASPLYESKPRL